MLVVADTSPFVVLINIRHVDVLPVLFSEIIIPPQISVELANAQRPPAVQAFIANRPNWLKEESPVTIETIPRLGLGERAAISLASQLKADLLLIDETLGRRAAAARKIRITGTIGVLELAADQKLLDLAEAFNRIKKTDFWISDRLLDQRLKLYLSKKGKP